jgi:hypothetical protein
MAGVRLLKGFKMAQDEFVIEEADETRIFGSPFVSGRTIFICDERPKV